jgi:hypothetical protein
LALAACFSLSASLAAAPAMQGGYTTDKHRELGLAFPRARDYEAIPLQPDEKWIVLQYAEKVPKDEEKQRALRPEMSFVWIDYVPDPSLRTGFGDPGLGAGDTGDPASGGEAKPAEEKKSSEPPINTIERYVEREMTKWSLGTSVEVKEREGYEGREFPLVFKDPKLKKRVVGRVFAYTKPSRTIAIIGYCASEDFDKQSKIWRHTFELVNFSEPEEQSTEKLERMYARTPYLDPAFRIEARKKLVRGWKAEDTKNFIVVFDTPDEPLMRKVCRDIELLREEYMKLFPPVGEMTAVSTVRICKDQDEYQSYGGPPRTAGYWYDVTEELVLYDAEKLVKKRQDDSDTFITLYHEAFHQYIHYSSGELSPHSWFNEGHGDYFSGAQVRDGKVRSIGVNPWRIYTIQRAIAHADFVPWEEIVKFEREQYYEPSMVGVCYAQGWSMIYFLRTAKEVAANPKWAKILPVYFDTLKASYKDELAKLSPEAQKDRKLRAPAGLAARKAAVKAAFEDVDFNEIEESWSSYVLALKPPK